MIFLIQNCFTNRNNYLPTLLFYSFLEIYFHTDINLDFMQTLKGTFFFIIPLNKLIMTKYLILDLLLPLREEHLEEAGPMSSM